MSRERRVKRAQVNRRYKILSAIAKIEGLQFYSDAAWEKYFEELLARGVISTWRMNCTYRIIAANIDCRINIKEAQHILEGAFS